MTPDDLIEKEKVKMCSSCGKYPADYPSDICAGCEAYEEHVAY